MSEQNSYAALKARGWVALRDFCTIADVSYPTGLKWCKLKMINFIQVGGTKRIYAEEIERFLKEGTLPPDEDLHKEAKAKETARHNEYNQRRLTQTETFKDEDSF
jgi:hypothetical protein